MSKTKVLIIFSVIIALFVLAFVSAVPANTFFKSYLHTPSVSDPGFVNVDTSFDVSLFTGAATYAYPILVPPGTAGLQPEIIVSYSSQAANSIDLLASGWSITQNYVMRDINYTRWNSSDDYFVLFLNGKRHELVYNTGDASYHTIPETFMQIKNFSGGNNSLSNYWIVKEPSGVAYRFGYNGDSELVSTLESFAVRWYLDLINDTHQNIIQYNYVENPNSGESSATYPVSIKYNRDLKRSIVFELENSNRPDQIVSYKDGTKTLYKKRIGKINVTADGLLVRQYRFTYGSTDTDARPSLDRITLIANDGITNISSTQFAYTTITKGWTSNSTWITPVALEWSYDNGGRFEDLNRDGYVDLLQGYFDPPFDPEGSVVYMNNKSGWVNSTLQYPMGHARHVDFEVCGDPDDQGGVDRGVRSLDVNYDGFPDIIFNPHPNISGSTDRDVSKKSYTWNGTTWVINSTWLSPSERIVDFELDEIYCIGSYGIDKGLRILDLNDDGYPDMIKADTPSNKKAWLNNKNGWQEITHFIPDERITTNLRPDLDCPFQYGVDNGFRFADVNGDGLIDIVKSRDHDDGGTEQVLLNDGKNFVLDSSWDIPGSFQFVEYIDESPQCDSRFGVDQGYRLADVNGDNLADILVGDAGTQDAYINNGTGWNLDLSWEPPTDFVTSDNENLGVRLVDLNGDGFVDIAKVRDTRNAWINKAASNPPRLLRQIITDLGGNYTIAYTSSSATTNNGQDNISDLPFNVWVVSSVTKNNQVSNNNVQINTSYSYSNGFYDFTKKEFRGFQNVTVRDIANQRETLHFFHQDYARKGQEYHTFIKDVQGNQFMSTNLTWTNTSVNGTFLVQLTSSLEQQYDGSSTNPLNISTIYSYDAYGNVAQSNVTSMPNSQNDNVERFEYVYNTTAWIVNRVSSYQLKNSTGSIISQNWNMYDSGTYNQAPSRGDITERKDWLNTANKNISTRFTYDSLGNIIQEISPLNQTTTYVYNITDTTSTFVNKIMNALNHTTTYVYDLGTGNIGVETDPNGNTIERTYDSANRPSKVIFEYDSETYPTIQYEYFFDGIAPEKVIEKKLETVGTNNTINTEYYYDGFGRIIQKNIEAPNSQVIVQDIFYDSNYNLMQLSNAYRRSATANYSAPDLTIPRFSFGYDVLDRMTHIQNQESRNKTIAYEKTIITVTDEMGRTTQYSVDPQNTIRSITDADDKVTTYMHDNRGNILEIRELNNTGLQNTYDSINRMTSRNSSDRGRWTYTYDDAGNLLTEVDARGTTVSYTYDSLNRLTRKNSTGQTLVNTYDIFKNGTLSNSTINAINYVYTYDKRLRLTQEEMTIDGQTFSQEWSYKPNNQISSQLLPFTNITYTYDASGNIYGIDNIIDETTYVNLDDVSQKIYANNAEVAIEYNNRTQVSSLFSSELQDEDYEYNALGSIVTVTDNIDSRTLNVQYDNLNRLSHVNLYDTNTQGYKFYINYGYDVVGRLQRIYDGGNERLFQFSSTPYHAPALVQQSNSSFIQVEQLGGYDFIDHDVEFNCLVTSQLPLRNVSLYITDFLVPNLIQTIQTNQTSYQANFSYTYSADNFGNSRWKCTATDISGRNVSSGNRHFDVVTLDSWPSEILLISPTPVNGTQQSTNFSIYVNTSTSESVRQYVAMNYNHDMLLWITGDEINNQTLYDISGYGNNATLINGTHTDYGSIYNTGKFGDALIFDGVNDYVTVPDHDSLQGTDLTIAAWIKNTGSGTQIIVDQLSSPTNGTRGLYTDADGTFHFFGYWSSGNDTDSNIQVRDNKWHHVAATRDDVANMRTLYVDGVKVMNYSDFETGLSNPNLPFNIGGRPGSNIYFNGSIDEVLVFNRSLRPEEIKTLYNSSEYRYELNFTDLSQGSYLFNVTQVNRNGHKHSAQFIVNDTIKPAIEFVPPTPMNGSSFLSTPTINISSSDYNKHYTILDFDRDLLFWMRMDDLNASGQPLDNSTYHNNATMSGANITAKGFYGYGSVYDGVDDYIRVSDSSSLTTTDITVAAWIKNFGTGTQIITEQLSSSSGNTRGMYVDSDGTLRFFGNWSGSGQDDDSNVTVRDGQWHHVVVTRNDLDNKRRFYVDGRNVANFTDTQAGQNNPNSDMYIGIRSGSTIPFNGSIDEVLIFGRALLDREVKALYNATATQYEATLSNKQLIPETVYTFRGYSVDILGNWNMTDLRYATYNPPSSTNVTNESLIGGGGDPPGELWADLGRDSAVEAGNSS